MMQSINSNMAIEKNICVYYFQHDFQTDKRWLNSYPFYQDSEHKMDFSKCCDCFIVKSYELFNFFIFLMIPCLVMRSILHLRAFKRSVFFLRICSFKIWMEMIFNYHQSTKSKHMVLDHIAMNLVWIWIFSIFFKIEKKPMYTTVHASISSACSWFCYPYPFTECSYGNVIVAGQWIPLYSFGNDKSTHF